MQDLDASVIKLPQYFASFMKYELIWHNANLNIHYCPEFNFLNAAWHGSSHKSQIMEDCEILLNSVATYNCRKLIIDISKVKVESNFFEALDWITNDYAPRLNAGGINYAAWIYSEKSEIRPSADEILRKSITETVSIVFDNLENAERWIKAL